MTKFQIEPHDRLHEWIADEKGYFEAEGLDYEFLTHRRADVLAPLVAEGASEIKRGATEFFEENQGGHLSCACQWAVNIAAATGHGKLYSNAYVVCPAAIYVPPASHAKRVEDLASLEIAVGYRSGSHFSALQALETVLPRDQIRLSFKGRPDMRVHALIRREVEAANVIGFTTYLLEQLGFRKILDTTFIVGFLVRKDVDAGDLEKYFRAKRRAQGEIDRNASPYKHYYLNHLREPLRSLADVRTFGPGERIVFEPYTAAMFEETARWMESWGLNPEMQGTADFEAAALF